MNSMGPRSRIEIRGDDNICSNKQNQLAVSGDCGVLARVLEAFRRGLIRLRRRWSDGIACIDHRLHSGKTMQISDDLLATIYQTIAVSGVIVALLGWWGRRQAPVRWCPDCGRDLSETESMRCASCGFSSPREADFRRRRRSWGVLIAGLVIVATASAFSVASGVAATTTRMIGPAWQSIESRSLPNGWTVEHEASRDLDRTGFSRRVRVTRDGVPHFAWTGRHVRLGFDDPVTGRRDGLGTDVDRNGEPDLVLQLSDVSEGVRTRWLVLSLADRTVGARLEPAAVLFDGRFEDIDGDGRPEFLAGDPTLRDEWAVAGALQVPMVALRPDAGGWRFSRTATEAIPMPSDLDVDVEVLLTDATVAWREARSPFVSPLFSLALNLTARGRGDEALALLNETWPGDDDPESVRELETIIDRSTGLPRRYVATPEGRESVWRELLERWRWGDRYLAIGPDPQDPR